MASLERESVGSVETDKRSINKKLPNNTPLMTNKLRREQQKGKVDATSKTTVKILTSSRNSSLERGKSSRKASSNNRPSKASATKQMKMPSKNLQDSELTQAPRQASKKTSN